MSFIDRLSNLAISAFIGYAWKKSTRDAVQPELSKQLPHIPTLEQLEHRQSLNLINSHFSFSDPLPLLPNQVEVGGMHLRPSKPLPQELESFLSGSTPVIYFSLGSQVKSTDLSSERIQILLNTFKKLQPFKVLWKYEDEFENLPENIRVQKWMPQQDVLAHSNVKVFISHCGLLGSQEALYSGKPMLCLPVFAEQPRNAINMQRRGYGRVIQWDDLSEELLLKELTELISNPSYTETAEEISRTFRDQLNPPTERAVYWTEYVVRHHGTTFLKSAQADQTWVEFLNLDILFAVSALLYILYRLVTRVFKLLTSRIRNIFRRKKDNGKGGKKKNQ